MKQGRPPPRPFSPPPRAPGPSSPPPVWGGGGGGIVGGGSPFLPALVDIVPGFVAAETAGGTGGGIADIAIIDGGRSTVGDRPSWVLRTDQPPAGITVP